MQLFEQVHSAERPPQIAEALTPFLDRNLLLVLWNATAKVTAVRSLEREPTPIARRGGPSPWDEARKRASQLAARVLHERVRLVAALGQTMSREERAQLHRALDPATTTADAPNSLRAVMRSLEETYAAEQIHRHRQLSISRLIGRRPTQEAQAGSPLQRLSIAANPETDSPGTPDTPTAIPGVLLGAFTPKRPSRPVIPSVANDAPSQHQPLPPEGVLEAFAPIMRVCEEAFDLLCEDGFEFKPSIAESADHSHVVEAKRLLCDLLNAYGDVGDEIIDKFQRSEAARLAAMEEAADTAGDLDDGMSTLVHNLIAQHKQYPALLVTAINRNPELLTDAVAQNHGILFFAVTKFAGAVKRFLRLDPKACDYLDALTAKHSGIQLLWSGNASLPSGSFAFDNGTSAGDALHLLEWFSAHAEDFAALFLAHPEPLKQLFVDMHTGGDVAAFYRLMVLLQSTSGVHSFITRASVTALERIAQEDQGAVLNLLRAIFADDGSSIGGNRDLLHQLQQSPFLATCLAEFRPTMLQDVFATHADAWASYFVDIAASNDAILRQSIVQRVSLLVRAMRVAGHLTHACLLQCGLDRKHRGW